MAKSYKYFHKKSSVLGVLLTSEYASEFVVLFTTLNMYSTAVIELCSNIKKVRFFYSTAVIELCSNIKKVRFFYIYVKVE